MLCTCRREWTSNCSKRWSHSQCWQTAVAEIIHSYQREQTSACPMTCADICTTKLVVISIRVTRPNALTGSLVDAADLSALCASQLYVLITIMADSCMLRSKSRILPLYLLCFTAIRSWLLNCTHYFLCKHGNVWPMLLRLSSILDGFWAVSKVFPHAHLLRHIKGYLQAISEARVASLHHRGDYST